jgi:hypothetical protein
MAFLVVNVLLGFLAAAILQAIFYHLMDFRAQWFDTLFASLLTSGVSGATYFCAEQVFDVGAKSGMFKLLGATLVIACAAGLLAFRFMIKSEAGTYLSWRTSTLISVVLVGPPVLVMSLIMVAV